MSDTLNEKPLPCQICGTKAIASPLNELFWCANRDCILNIAAYPIDAWNRRSPSGGGAPTNQVIAEAIELTIKTLDAQRSVPRQFQVIDYAAIIKEARAKQVPTALSASSQGREAATAGDILRFRADELRGLRQKAPAIADDLARIESALRGLKFDPVTVRPDRSYDELVAEWENPRANSPQGEDGERLDWIEQRRASVSIDTGSMWTVWESEATGGDDYQEVELTRGNRQPTIRRAIDAARRSASRPRDEGPHCTDQQCPHFGALHFHQAAPLEQGDGVTPTRCPETFTQDITAQCALLVGHDGPHQWPSSESPKGTTPTCKCGHPRSEHLSAYTHDRTPCMKATDGKYCSCRKYSPTPPSPMCSRVPEEGSK